MAEQTEGLAPKRDVRVDRIGFAKELEKHFVDPLKAAVKDAHEVGTRLEGDFFEGLIIQPDETSVNASAWLRLHEAKEISRAEFLEGIRVSSSVASKTLDARTFRRISTTSPGPKKLMVTRKKGVELALVDAVQALNDDVRTSVAPLKAA